MHRYLKQHPFEIKQKALELVKSGLSRREAAKTVGVSYFTVVFWAKELLPAKKHSSTKLRYKARRLVKEGISRLKISEILGVSYPTVLKWTKDLGSPFKKRVLAGRMAFLASQSVKKGYIFCNKEIGISTYRVLKKNFDVKYIKVRIKWHKASMIYLRGEKNAIKAHISKNGLHSLNETQLNSIKAKFINRRELFIERYLSAKIAKSIW